MIYGYLCHTLYRQLQVGQRAYPFQILSQRAKLFQTLSHPIQQINQNLLKMIFLEKVSLISVCNSFV